MAKKKFYYSRSEAMNRLSASEFQLRQWIASGELTECMVSDDDVRFEVHEVERLYVRLQPRPQASEKSPFSALVEGAKAVLGLGDEQDHSGDRDLTKLKGKQLLSIEEFGWIDEYLDEAPALLEQLNDPLVPAFCRVLKAKDGAKADQSMSAEDAVCRLVMQDMPETFVRFLKKSLGEVDLSDPGVRTELRRAFELRRDTLIQCLCRSAPPSREGVTELLRLLDQLSGLFVMSGLLKILKQRSETLKSASDPLLVKLGRAALGEVQTRMCEFGVMWKCRRMNAVCGELQQRRDEVLGKN